jgi:hypothetical protein
MHDALAYINSVKSGNLQHRKGASTLTRMSRWSGKEIVFAYLGHHSTVCKTLGDTGSNVVRGGLPRYTLLDTAVWEGNLDWVLRLACT